MHSRRHSLKRTTPFESNQPLSKMRPPSHPLTHMTFHQNVTQPQFAPQFYNQYYCMQPQMSMVAPRTNNHPQSSYTSSPKPPTSPMTSQQPPKQPTAPPPVVQTTAPTLNTSSLIDKYVKAGQQMHRSPKLTTVTTFPSPVKPDPPASPPPPPSPPKPLAPPPVSPPQPKPTEVPPGAQLPIFPSQAPSPIHSDPPTLTPSHNPPSIDPPTELPAPPTEPQPPIQEEFLQITHVQQQPLPESQVFVQEPLPISPPIKEEEAMEEEYKKEVQVKPKVTKKHKESRKAPRRSLRKSLIPVQSHLNNELIDFALSDLGGVSAWSTYFSSDQRFLCCLGGLPIPTTQLLSHFFPSMTPEMLSIGVELFENGNLIPINELAESLKLLVKPKEVAPPPPPPPVVEALIPADEFHLVEEDVSVLNFGVGDNDGLVTKKPSQVVDVYGYPISVIAGENDLDDCLILGRAQGDRVMKVYSRASRTIKPYTPSLCCCSARCLPFKELLTNTSRCVALPTQEEFLRMRQRISALDTETSASSRSTRRQMRDRLGGYSSKGASLGKRTKLLQLDKSPIHAWGLYALEPIEKEEAVCEYVGEIIRSKVSDIRESIYNRSGMGDSYLFRLDNQYVIDATYRGSVARYINHSCDPNCYAKVIASNGDKKVVIYAFRDISVGEEITYDYKFPIEDDESKVVCHCKSVNCRKFLN
ncbi:hypothetical protein GEMRC1_008700 [Eukaryota sp. GEM-RC1]